ncbi:hypothetical protein [Dolichospermum sp. UHCC 0259]|uniref:hypothetical protein n=1 Tax=Dolichospermum sp. UHCC 0259 TaxID=2590010 RepID=UPI0014461911|nr:hypothetical protein [Dolichospermum sp. UHCC 0259]MTJ48386.1 hypothetical protein [Dolichospermum sp. UHCC 0259]
MKLESPAYPVQLQMLLVSRLIIMLKNKALLSSPDTREAQLKALNELELRLSQPTQTPKSVGQINQMFSWVVSFPEIKAVLNPNGKIQLVFDYSCLYNML